MAARIGGISSVVSQVSRAAVLVALAFAGLLLCARLAPPAEAAFVADAPDPAGDASSADPAHDILGIGFGYDRRTGQVVGAIRLGSDVERESAASVTLVAGTRTANGCDGPAIVLASSTDAFDASWYRFATPETVTARGEAGKRGYLDRVQRYEATGRALRGLRPDCVMAALTEPGNAQNVYDTFGPVRLRPLPGLSLRLGGLPRRTRGGRDYTLKVTVANPGDAPTGRVAVRLARLPGMSARPRALTLRSIAPGRRRTASLTIRFGERAPVTPDLEVTATAGRLRVEEEISTVVSRRDKPGRGGGGGGGGGIGVCTQWFPDFSGETGGSLGLVPCQR